MKNGKQLKRNTNPPKHLPALKKGNKRKAGKIEVNQTIIEFEHRLEQFHSILIHRPIEVIPVHDEEHLRKLEESYNRESRYRDEMQNTSDVIFKPRSDGHPTVISKSDFMYDKPGLLEKVELGLRIGKFIKTQDQNLAARIIRDFPEIIFNDCAEIYLWLFISHNPSELNKLLQQWRTDSSIFTGVMGENPFAVQIYRWEFLNQWGNRQEKKEAKKYLKDVGLEVFSHLLRRGKPRGSGVSKKMVTETYKTILRDFDEHFKAKGKPRDNVDKIKMLREYIMTKGHIGSVLSFVESQDKDVFWEAEKIAKKLLGIDASKINNAKAWGKRGKKNEEEKTKTIHPFNPSNIALHLTRLFYKNISPDTVRTAIYRK